MTAFQDDMMRLIYLGENIDVIADNAAVNPVTNLYVALHTADPNTGDGYQSTFETDYPGYQRAAVLRDATEWGINAGIATINNDIIFPMCLGISGQVVSYFSIGMSGSDPSKIIHAGQLTPPVTIHDGVEITINAGGTITLSYI